MSRRKQRRRNQNRKKAQANKATPSTALDQNWSRAGAHNIAGVSFQVAVTAKLLLDGQTDKLPLTRVTPEGYEDIDIEFRDETRALVQVKERSPTTTFRRSDLAKALAKKSAALSQDVRCTFVLATNATLGEGIAVTGWDQTLLQCLLGDEVKRLAVQIQDFFDEPNEVLARTHILSIERSVVEESRFDFA